MTLDPTTSAPEKPPPSGEAAHARIVGQTVLTVFGLHHSAGAISHHFGDCQSAHEVLTTIAHLKEAEFVGIVALTVMLLLMLYDLIARAFAYLQKRVKQKA